MSDFRILKTVDYDTRGYVDEQLLYKSGLVSASALTRNLTYLYGKDKDMYPLLANVYGMSGNAKGKEVNRELNDYRYYWPIMGKARMTSICAGLSIAADVTPGQGKPVKIKFEDNLFIPTHVIYSPKRQLQVRLLEGMPTRSADGKYEYNGVFLDGQGYSFIPLDEFEAGLAWVTGGTATAASKTEGIYAHVHTPGRMTNQLGYFRYSFVITGNVSNKVTSYIISDKDGGKQEMWLPEMIVNWGHSWRADNEFELWESKYNRTESGEILNKDNKGEPIPRGAGLKQQVKLGGNSGYYTKLTLKRFDNILNKIYYDQEDSSSDAGFMEIVLYTGRGGREVFNQTIKSDIASKGDGYMTKLGDKELEEYKGMLTYGRNVERYRTVHGNILTIRTLDMLDKGKIARMQRQNGDVYNGHPNCSYDMYFIDHSTYNNERNIQYVYEKGMEFQEGVYKGFTDLPEMWNKLLAKNNDKSLATREDIATYEVKGSHGVAMLKNTTSFILEFQK